MSEAVQNRSGWSAASPEVVGAMANTAAAAEIAVRAAAGAVGVQTAARLVRDYPVLTLLAATGIGYLVGRGWGGRETRPAANSAKPAATR